MNKIVLDRKDIIDIVIDNNNICNIDKDYSIKELNIELKENAKFIINQYSEIEKEDLKINIVHNNNSEFIYNHSFINKGEYNLDININLEGNNSKNDINIHGISDNGVSKIKVDGSVLKNTLDNELYENIKLINMNEGFSYIYPNMYIDTKNVVATHAASISTVNEDYLFYLMSKGLDRNNATKTLINGFLENIAK